MEKVNRKKIGKQNKAKGLRFERSVRKDLEDKKWIVSKWMNNVEFHNNEDIHGLPFIVGKLVPAKHNFCGIGRPMALGTGFPDFITFRWIWKVDLEKALGVGMVLESTKSFPINGLEDYCGDFMMWEVVGVEVKSNGYLDKEEKSKCKWLLDNKVFSRILIAKKGKKRGEIVYDEFK